MDKPDIKSPEDIYLLVSEFYKKVRHDKELGPFFNNSIKDWDAHFEHLTAFWESNLFLETKYFGNPLDVHIKVDKANSNSITELHFGLWLNLWYQTIDELYQGEYADMAKRRARKMGTFMYLKIFEARNQ
ncbi:MAG: group III truncated hemoglobin [Winogradskyella sp.]|uniref:group III truncated hemoglobin n=1 Tax=Winogradskyella sp. TaxID=1883156 RepID=UPI000F3EC36A|nr:group III truncated hemoglobin [Winogradskyella sp.]RNC86463.1 MAG: group III truncated hemoglobin [Winogradskyella sp.]